jgi:hypothetical protein
MKFADIEGNDQEAQPGLTGKCRDCGHAVFTKCGQHRVWHWAHWKSKDCDPWREPETEWHRWWKNQFPVAWQEIGHTAQSGERHRADVKTEGGLVIEFQRNLFVVFGEPDIKWDFNTDGEIVVEVLGVDVFDPKTGAVRASGKDDIAAWFIDTDYNEESFFVRHAYFMGANDPYKSLKTALKAEIDEDAWATLYRDTSRPFPRPDTGRFAVKVINHFGDEVMKIFAV